MGEAGLEAIIEHAAARFRANLEEALPVTAPMLDRWLRRVPAPPNMVATCLAVRSFPAFSMPFWLTPPEARRDDLAFQRDIAYSTLNGYFFVRLLDNVADGDGPLQLHKLLPAAGYFNAQFLAPYRRYFDADHQFWWLFEAAWNQQAESSSVDAFLDDIDIAKYTGICAKKFSASKGPLAAVALRYDRGDVLPAWSDFVDRLGAFSQFVNDLFDWHHDSEERIETYLQSEFRRRRMDGEPIGRWMAREGFAWGADLLRAWISDLHETGERLGSLEAVAWIEARALLLDDELAKGEMALAALRRIAGLIP